MIHSATRLLKSGVRLALGKLGYGLVRLPKDRSILPASQVAGFDQDRLSASAESTNPAANLDPPDGMEASAPAAIGTGGFRLDPFTRVNDTVAPDIFIESHDLKKTPLGVLLDLLEGYARPLAEGKRTLVWLFERTGATGHLCMEPFYIKSVYGELFDEIIVITRQRHSCHNSNTEIFDTSMTGMKVAFTDDPYIFNLSAYEIGLVERGPFAFLLHSYAHISRAFFHHCLNGGRKTFFTLTPNQEERGRKAFSDLGIPSDAKWVVVHAREGGFHPRSIDNNRCTSIESYFDSIKYLVSQGYFVLRVGDRTMKRLPDFGGQVYDVPFLPNYDFMLDVFAVAHCEFMMSANSGPCMLARAFDRPCLAINVPLIFAHIPGERDMVAFRRYFLAGVKGAPPRLLSYREIVDSGLQYVSIDRSFREQNISFRELTSAEVMPITREMFQRQTVSHSTPPRSHDRFMAINRLAHERASRDPALQRIRYDWYGLAKKGSGIPEAYCELLLDFL